MPSGRFVPAPAYLPPPHPSPVPYTPPPRPFAAALAVLALAAGALGGCTRQTPPGLPPGMTVDDLPDSESWGARLRATASGLPRLEIEAPYLARYARPDTAYVYLGPAPDGPTGPPVAVEVFDDEGRPMARVASREAWYYEAGGRLVAEGDVTTSVQGEAGAEIRAERITLEEGAVVAEGDVRATVRGGGGAQIQAARVATSQSGAFEASGGAVVQLTGGAQATVRAQRVSGTGGGRYEAEGGVRVETASGRTLEAPRVVWDEGAGQFRAPGAFSFDGPGERVRGEGLVASADLSRYSFRNVTGVIEVQE